MKISEALQERKHLKEQITRLYALRNENFKVLINKDISIEEAKKEPKKHRIIVFEDITKEIDEGWLKEINLRESILKTNLSTTIDFPSDIIEGLSGEMSLAKLKICYDKIVGDLKSLMSLKSDRMYDPRRIISVDDQQKAVPQLDDLEIEKMLQDLEAKKRKISKILDLANAKTELQ